MRSMIKDAVREILREQAGDSSTQRQGPPGNEAKGWSERALRWAWVAGCMWCASGGAHVVYSSPAPRGSRARQPKARQPGAEAECSWPGNERE